MNPEWSELNKAVQIQLKNEATFSQGIETLLALRQFLMDELLQIKEELSKAELSAMPFPKAEGYHSKTIAYSVWHIFRIEDIVANSLIQQDKEVLCGSREKIGAPIITTGNELVGAEIADFLKSLDSDSLYAYALAVKEKTDTLLKSLSYRDLNRKFNDTDQERLRALQVVSADESAQWLVDFWCRKNIRGLIPMPFSRHWIMHIEASLRMKNKIRKERTGKREQIQYALEIPANELPIAACFSFCRNRRRRRLTISSAIEKRTVRLHDIRIGGWNFAYMAKLDGGKHGY